LERWVLTGPPGAGKTAIVNELERRGWMVVPEAATDVIAAMGSGDDHWKQPEFLDRIVSLQRQRQEVSPPSDVRRQVFDRSPLCTLALAHYLDLTASQGLLDEVDRVTTGQVYMRTVFFVEWIGFLTPTEIRQIDEAGTVRFAEIHRQVYADHGFELVDVPVAPVQERASSISTLIANGVR